MSVDIPEGFTPGPWKLAAEVVTLRAALAEQTARIAALEAENAALERESDDRLQRLHTAEAKAQDIYIGEATKVAALEAERERLREALLPFKHEADRITPLGTNAEASIGGGVQIWQSGPMSVARTAITYGDLRIARAALQEPNHAG